MRMILSAGLKIVTGFPGVPDAVGSSSLVLYADISEEEDTLRIFFDNPMGDCTGKQNQFKVFSSKQPVKAIDTALADDYVIVLTLDRVIGYVI